MQRIHPLSPELCAAAGFRVEVILPFAAHQNLAVLGHLEPLGVGFN